MILHLTLKKKWFDMILSGEKTEEYREIKDYWKNRFLTVEAPFVHRFKNYSKIKFTNGYSKNAPFFIIECLGIDYGKGKEDWGVEKGKDYFVIKLGKILTT